MALLARAREGDQKALEEVFARAILLLPRWASGRLPRWARDLVDTDDLVQDTVVNTLKRIDVFEYRADAALQAYLRQAVMNRIRNDFAAPAGIRRPKPSTRQRQTPVCPRSKTSSASRPWRRTTRRWCVARFGGTHGLFHRHRLPSPRVRSPPTTCGPSIIERNSDGACRLR